MNNIWKIDLVVVLVSVFVLMGLVGYASMNRNIYKFGSCGSIDMIPGDPNGLPNESFLVEVLV